MSTLKLGYASTEAQRAFLDLPKDDQHTLELKHWVQANAMHVIYKAQEIRDKFSGEKSIFLESIDKLDVFSKSLKKHLSDQGIFYIGQLVSRPNADDISFQSERSCQDLKKTLKLIGLEFGMSIPEEDIMKFIDTFRSPGVIDAHKTIGSLNVPGGYNGSPTWQALMQYFSPIAHTKAPLSYQILYSNGVYYFGQLAHFTNEELCSMPGMTKEAILELNLLRETGMIVSSLVQIPDGFMGGLVEKLYKDYSYMHRASRRHVHSRFALEVMEKNGLNKGIPTWKD